jgi:hypothetical protein
VKKIREREIALDLDCILSDREEKQAQEEAKGV